VIGLIYSKPRFSILVTLSRNAYKALSRLTNHNIPTMKIWMVFFTAPVLQLMGQTACHLACAKDKLASWNLEHSDLLSSEHQLAFKWQIADPWSPHHAPGSKSVCKSGNWPLPLYQKKVCYCIITCLTVCLEYLQSQVITFCLGVDLLMGYRGFISTVN
jgi:hypothetical protein